jgi:electron transport complex protein RnfC
MLRLIKASWPHPEVPEPPVHIELPQDIELPDEVSWPPVPANEPLRKSDQTYPEFLDAIGLVGMGGSMFPAARKLEACRNVHTLVINAVECEPGITIDKALLLYHSDLVKAGAEASAAASGASRIVIAIARNRKLSRRVAELYPFVQVMMPRGYPGGAEKLIVKKLSRRMLPAGALPSDIGYLVQNIASLRAIGRALKDNIPVVERPLTVAAPHLWIHHDLILPVGLSVGTALKMLDLRWDRETEVLIAGGLMMGRAVTEEFRIAKGTTSLLIMQRKGMTEEATHCINCGACNAACPLGLHPIGMVRPFINRKSRISKSVNEQIDTCFLCGACAAVCPAHIPLVKYIKEGKACRQST